MAAYMLVKQIAVDRQRPATFILIVYEKEMECGNNTDVDGHRSIPHAARTNEVASSLAHQSICVAGIHLHGKERLSGKRCV